MGFFMDDVAVSGGPAVAAEALRSGVAAAADPLLSHSHISASTVGSSFIEIANGGLHARVGIPTIRGGGRRRPRGKVHVFSAASRRRFRGKLLRLDARRIVDEGLAFTTLTQGKVI